MIPSSRIDLSTLERLRDEAPDTDNDLIKECWDNTIGRWTDEIKAIPKEALPVVKLAWLNHIRAKIEKARGR
jgi:hypothetical protein